MPSTSSNARAASHKFAVVDFSSILEYASLEHSQFGQLPVLEAGVRQVASNHEGNDLFAELLLGDVEGVPVAQILCITNGVLSSALRYSGEFFDI